MTAFLWVTLGTLSMAGAFAYEPASGPSMETRPFSDPANITQPSTGAPGFPSANAGVDAQAGFLNPPFGYGEVPYWWWTGDPLDKERLLWQLDKLHAMGLPGVQINYAHDTQMRTYAVDPPIFSDAWWDTWRWITGECHKRGMGIGISGYTIDWPGKNNLFRQIGITDGSLRGASLAHATKRAEGGKPLAWDLPEHTIALIAYRLNGDTVQGEERVDLLPAAHARKLEWMPPDGQWQVVAVHVESPEYSVDPMNPASGQKVLERFFQPFAEHCPGDMAGALNYFFQDELNFGVDGWLWNDTFAGEFLKRKGYDITPLLPALFTDVGSITPKVRLDYSDVMVSLTEENYFRPIFDWHWKRGLIYACDPGSRGGNPLEFGDYFRCVRWYSAPGHDTPGGSADLRKDKVSSSIAHLYQRPRVWLEGYHSLGWGATPATIFDSSCKNFLYGATLLNLHGLYYTTHGGYWEWAPPCFHFRMPYWEHMGAFFKYFERLSYLLSQGTHVCDVAILYPVAALEAGMGGQESLDTAFGIGSDLYLKNGIDFDFIDFESLARAEVRERQLQVSGEGYRVLILPAMRALRYSTLEKALEFQRAGGIVIGAGALPEASDRAGRDDPELDTVVKTLFGVTAADVAAGTPVAKQVNDAGGIGLACLGPDMTEHVTKCLADDLLRDFIPQGTAQVLHRRIGLRDVYMVMGAAKNSECFFRAKGNVEYWNPWKGTTQPLYAFSPCDSGTRVRMPLDAGQAQLIVFSPAEPGWHIEQTDLDDIVAVKPSGNTVTVEGIAYSAGRKMAVVRSAEKTVELSGNAAEPLPPLPVEGVWEFELKPTMDNRWGDFRLPASNTMIGPEARRFLYREETSPGCDWQAASLDTSQWVNVTNSFGTRFWKLGPLPEGMDLTALDTELAAITQIDPAQPVKADGHEYHWQPYEFSMRWNLEKDPGPQGYHGLKENISDDFICLGKPKYTGTAFAYEKEEGGTHYYLWTSALSARKTGATLHLGALKPASIWINNAPVADTSAVFPLAEGGNPLLLRFDTVGRTHAVLEYTDTPAPTTTHPLAMTWYANDAVVPLDAKPQDRSPAGWYRFVSPPGLRSMRIVAHGTVQAWADGKPLDIQPGERGDDGAAVYTALITQPQALAVNVALRVQQERGWYGGAAIPEPITLDCVPGHILPGDWAKAGVLEHYSGGAWYRKTVSLTTQQATGRVTLDLGRVVATAEVRVNGQTAGILSTPPWAIDISKQVTPGDNRIEILVYNTLANHYGTIPTQYRGDPVSGLLGPVTIQTMQPVVLVPGT